MSDVLVNPTETIQKIVSLLEEEGLLVRGAGNKYYCPICETPGVSKSPSFAVSYDKKIAKCFSDKCGARFIGLRGFVVLYARLKGISFAQAVKELRSRGVETGLYPSDLEIVMDFYRERLLHPTSSYARSALSRLKYKGVDVDKDIFLAFPVGLYLPLPQEIKASLSKKIAKEIERVEETLGSLATVHGYFDPNTGEIKALKFIPFDSSFRTIKERIFTLAPDGLTNLVHGPYYAFNEEFDEVYVAEGEMDALAAATRMDYPVIAFGGAVQRNSKSGLPSKTYIILPDRFGDKRGEELAVDYISALGDGKEIKVVDYYRWQGELDEDPSEIFKRDYWKDLLSTCTVPADEFIADYILHKVPDPNDKKSLLQVLRELSLKLPRTLMLLVKDRLPQIEGEEFFRATVPVGGQITSDDVYEILSREFKVLLVESGPKDEIIYLKYKDKVGRINYTNKDRLLSYISTITGESLLDYLLSRLQLPDSFFYKKDGIPKTEVEILRELRPYVLMAFDKLKAEAAANGLVNNAEILKRGVYFIGENRVVIVSGKKAYLYDGEEVRILKDNIVDNYVVIPDENSDWLPEDFDWHRIKTVDPKSTYEKVVSFLQAVVKFPRQYEYQYKLLALLPFYANIYDAFKDRVLFVMFSGDSGSGKTTTMKYLVSSQKEIGIHRLILNAEFFSNYTPAGLRQALDKIRLAVGLDEAEPEVLDRVMDEFRSMISADSRTIRGSSDQIHVEQENRFCAFMSSIALPEKIQNLNRLLIFRFFKFDDVPTPVLALKKHGYDYDYQKELAYDIFASSLKILPKLKDARLAAEEKLHRMFSNIPARDIEAYSILMAVAEMLGVDVTEEMQRFVREMNLIRNVPAVKEQIHHEILNIQLNIEGKGVLALAEICLAVEKDEDLRDKLTARGIYYKDGWLSFPFVEGRRYISFNMSTVAAYLAVDDTMRFENGMIKINVNKLKEKLGALRTEDTRIELDEAQF